jgi:hypothetical protein
MTEKSIGEEQISEFGEHLPLLKDVVDSVEDELLVIDRSYRITMGNLMAFRRFKGSNINPLGQQCYRVIQNRKQPCSSPLWDCPLQNVLSSGHPSMVIHPSRTAGTDTYHKIAAFVENRNHRESWIPI